MNDIVEVIARLLANAEDRPSIVEGPDETEYPVTYGTDEDDNEYALIHVSFPVGVHAEIEDGTYGELQGIRVYI